MGITEQVDKIQSAYAERVITRPEAIKQLMALGYYRGEAITLTADITAWHMWKQRGGRE